MSFYIMNVMCIILYDKGLLDRVVHGVTAVEILKACDDAALKINVEDSSSNTQISLSQVLLTFLTLLQVRYY